MGLGDPRAFFASCKGTIHVVKEVELDIKFQEVAEVVKTANLDLDIAKSMLKAEQKKSKQGYGLQEQESQES